MNHHPRRLIQVMLASVLAVAVLPTGVRAAHDPVIVQDETTITMSDGVRLYAQVARVHDDVRRPVMITGTPYGNDATGATEGGQPGIARDLAELVDGDLVAVQFHLRGLGASEGLFDNWGAREREDAIAMVRWVATQPWSDGRVVTFGASGLGPWQYAPLSAHDPAIVAAVIRSTCVDFYRDCFHSGGASTALPAVTALVVEGYATAFEARVRLGLAANPDPAQQLAAIAATVSDIESNKLDSPYWRLRAATDEIASWTVPVMYAGGPYDLSDWGMTDAFLRTPNAWLHLNGGHSGGELVAATSNAAQVGFMRHFALGEPNGFDQEPRVRVVTGMGSRAGWTLGKVLARTEDTYPFPSTEWTRAYLGAGPSGSATSLNDGSLGLAQGNVGASDTIPVTNTTGPRSELRIVSHFTSLKTAHNRSPEQAQPSVDAAADAVDPADLRLEELTGLTYTTPPLTNSIELSGEPVAHFFLTSTVPDLDLEVRLTDVLPGGQSVWVTDGRLRLSLRRIDPDLSRRTPNGDIWQPWHPFDSPEPLQPGEVYEVFVHLGYLSNVFGAGDRIRLDVSGNTQSAPDATPQAGTITILRDAQHPSSILLPVIPQGCDRSVVAFPDAFPEVASPAPCAMSLAAALD